MIRDAVGMDSEQRAVVTVRRGTSTVITFSASVISSSLNAAIVSFSLDLRSLLTSVAYTAG